MADEQYIYLSPEEDLTSVRERLKKIPNRHIVGVFLGAQTVALLSLYALGFLAAVVTAKALKSSILKSGRTPFLLEMPSYRWPTAQSIGLRLLDRAKVFLRR